MNENIKEIEEENNEKGGVGQERVLRHPYRRARGPKTAKKRFPK